MRFPPSKEVEHCRIAGPHGDNYGAFIVKLGSFRLRCIVACGQGWDHVSVSLGNRRPTWAEMDAIKRLFWTDGEVVMQLHIGGASKVNVHPHCLHMWRPQTPNESEANRSRMVAAGEKAPENWDVYPPIPLPPTFMV